MLIKPKNFLFIAITLSNLSLINLTLAQTSSEQEKPVKKPTFFEEERKPKPDGFRETFLFDSLNGISDPLSGTGSSVSAVDRPIPNLPDSSFLDSIQLAPATFNLSIVNTSSIAPLPGKLGVNGNFTTVLPLNPPSNVTFNVGTTTFVVNQPIDVKNIVINSAFNSPAATVLLESYGVTRQNAESNITNATVIPSAIPRGPVLSGANGGFILGPVPDR
ncbi:MAG: hypothetical protein VKL41_19915 [Snowella sp.]|nr:hypothetical protein [Snowella sp.]